jgi:hypothetical protein
MGERMSQSLDRLSGMTLLAASSNEGGALLQFTDCVLAAYSSYAASRLLSSLVGLTVDSVDYSENASLGINFSSGDCFSISLRDENYVGPEAFSAEFSDGTYIVE